MIDSDIYFHKATMLDLLASALYQAKTIQRTFKHASVAFPLISGMIAPSQAVMVTMMLDNARKTEGFAQRLRTLRKARDLSQTQLGERAGLHYTHIGRFERGTSRPGGDTLKRLADSLDTTSDYLLEGATDDAAAARVTDRELLRQFQAVEHLPDADKHIVKTLLDAFLTRRQIEHMVR